MMFSDDNVDKSITSEHGTVNNLRVDLGGVTLLVVVVMVAIIAACGVVMGMDIADRNAKYMLQQQRDEQVMRAVKDMTTQAWLVERRYMDDEAYRILNGQKLQGDDSFGPTGNMQRMVPKKAK